MNRADVNIYGDIFSRVYHLYWTDFIDEIVPDLVKYVKDKGIDGKVLDLCCGTGRLSRKLSTYGFELHGIDISKDMISIAMKNNTNCVYSVGDARIFELDTRFPLIVSTFDAMNHMKDIAELKLVFERILFHLEDGGYLIFDMNTKRGLRSWNFVDVEDNDDITMIMYGKYVSVEKRAYTRVTGFVRDDDVYHKFNEVMTNTVFLMRDVETLLTEVGFVFDHFAKPGKLGESISDPEKYDRIMIVARKSCK